MDFVSFAVLLVISTVVSAVLHYGLKYYVNEDRWSFIWLGWGASQHLTQFIPIISGGGEVLCGAIWCLACAAFARRMV